ncbi:MAG: YIP1 family protein, partial [candidate division WOR-3 bacterium]
MKNFINIFTNPSAVFSSIKEKPEWSKPLMVVLVILSIISILTISTTRDLITAQQIEAMKDRKMTDEQIEQAMKFTSGAFIYVSAIFGTIIGVTVVLLLFALLLNLFIPVAGGEGSYKLVFSVVSYSALIKIPAHLLRWILIMLKHSLQVNTSLAL